MNPPGRNLELRSPSPRLKKHTCEPVGRYSHSSGMILIYPQDRILSMDAAVAMGVVVAATAGFSGT